MSVDPLTDFSRLCLHTITTKGWELEEAVERYAEAGVSGITVWRQWLEGRDPIEAGDRIRSAGLQVVSLCRGGFYPAVEEKVRKEAVEDNKQAIEDAAALGAPLVVLVCGAVPGQSLVESRKQITDGIAATLPLAESLGEVGHRTPPPHVCGRPFRDQLLGLGQWRMRRIEPSLGGHCLRRLSSLVGSGPRGTNQAYGRNGPLVRLSVCDWMTPTTDLLNDRGLMGEGCIDLRGIRGMVEGAGFDGMIEVEVFSNRWWSKPTDEFLQAIKKPI